MRALILAILLFLATLAPIAAACDTSCALGATTDLVRATAANALDVGNGAAAIGLFEVVVAGAFTSTTEGCALAADANCELAPAMEIPNAIVIAPTSAAGYASAFAGAEEGAVTAYEATLLS